MSEESDDKMFEAIEKQMGWDDPTRLVIGADYGNEDETVISVFRIEKDLMGQTTKVVLLHSSPPEKLKESSLPRRWIRAILKLLGR